MKRTILLGLLLLTGGCAGKGIDNKQTKTTIDKTKYLLAQEPAAAVHVIEVKKLAEDQAQVIAVGRIGGGKNPFTGQAAFTLVDARATPCNEIEGDDCPTPWDYCCEPDLSKKMILVKFVDDQGQTLTFDAEKALGLAPLQTIVVQGIMRVTDDGAKSIHASGIHVRGAKQ